MNSAEIRGGLAHSHSIVSETAKPLILLAEYFRPSQFTVRIADK